MLSPRFCSCMDLLHSCTSQFNCQFKGFLFTRVHRLQFGYKYLHKKPGFQQQSQPSSSGQHTKRTKANHNINSWLQSIQYITSQPYMLHADHGIITKRPNCKVSQLFLTVDVQINKSYYALPPCRGKQYSIWGFLNKVMQERGQGYLAYLAIWPFLLECHDQNVTYTVGWWCNEWIAIDYLRYVLLLFCLYVFYWERWLILLSKAWLLIKLFLPGWKPVNSFLHVFIRKASNCICFRLIDFLKSNVFVPSGLTSTKADVVSHASALTWHSLMLFSTFVWTHPW